MKAEGPNATTLDVTRSSFAKGLNEVQPPLDRSIAETAAKFVLIVPKSERHY